MLRVEEKGRQRVRRLDAEGGEEGETEGETAGC